MRRLLIGVAAVLVLLASRAAESGRASAYSQARRIVFAVFPRQTEQAALRVVRCESTYQPWVTSVDGARGLFQIMPFHVREPWRLYDPWYNTRVAYRLSRAGWDWTPWTCRP